MRQVKLEDFHMPTFRYEGEDHFVGKGIDVDTNSEFGDIFVVVGYLDVEEPLAVVMHGTRVAGGGPELWRTVKTYSAPESEEAKFSGTKFTNVRSSKKGFEIVGGVRNASTEEWSPFIYFGALDGSGSWFPVRTSKANSIAIAASDEYLLLQGEDGSYGVFVHETGETLEPEFLTGVPPVIKGIGRAETGEFIVLGED